MTKIAVPAGMPLAYAPVRMKSSSFGLPVLLSDGASAAASNRAPVTATAHATPHTVGAWAEVVAALSADVGWVKVTPTAGTSAAATDTSALLNIGVGAAASEVTVIDSLGVGWFNASAALPHPGWIFPLFIPKGSRVAIQAQAAVTLQAVQVRLEFFAPTRGIIPSRKVTGIGVDLAASKGVILATPGGNNTEGAWTQITAATAEPYGALGVSVQGGQDVTQSNPTVLIDVAVGASGNEVVIVSDLLAITTTNEGLSVSSPLVHPVDIPAGARLSARYQGVNTSSSFDVILHGVRRPM